VDTSHIGLPPRSHARRGPAWRPNDVQRLLLQAALLSGPGAVAAWRQWSARADPDRLDEGSNRLIPLLSANLDRLGVRDDLSGRLRGYRRRTWYVNQVRMRELEAVLGAFARSGIATVILKGAAFARTFYADHSLRPMSDLDILVRRDDALRVIAWLLGQGWTAVDRRVARRLAIFFPTGGADATAADAEVEARILQREEIGFARRGIDLDLHWRVLHQRGWPGAEDAFWDGSIETTVGAASTRMLNPTDSLLHVCEHGSRWNRVPPIRWIADAVMILRADGATIDWDRLVGRARELQVAFALGAMLGYLREEFDAPVPAACLAELRAIRTTWTERAEHRLTNRPPGELPFVWRLWLEHVRASRGRGWWRAVASFPRHLQYAFDLRGMSELPTFVVARTATRVVHGLRARIVEARPGHARP
jgi:putative nucleotidyltransferase-like protein